MPRFNDKKYDPGDDSSADRKTEARERGIVILDVKSRPDGNGIGCPCGCGHVPVGKKSRFMMGHDAKLRGILIRAHLTGTKMVEVIDGKEGAVISAMMMSQHYDWAPYLKQAELRREGKSRQVLRKALGSKRLVKVGRWEYTGEVVAIYAQKSGDEVEVEFVTKTGEIKKKRVPLSEAPLASQEGA